MSRRDRDQYIMVDTINKPKYVNQFMTSEFLENYGTSYDYGSIMHYRRGGLSKEEYVMIIPDSKYKNTLGSEMISFIDLAIINRHYNCTGKI
ncbi:astacin [Ancylostoma duodenale]|uniref:Metalloendopeptidase n=1 Tax=Ancylostoma duodenale TaxID=51022 RepID=A0A0C2CS14_9BILA|nr:astacin [Ancylostoma duodenale]